MPVIPSLKLNSRSQLRQLGLKSEHDQDRECRLFTRKKNILFMENKNVTLIYEMNK